MPVDPQIQALLDKGTGVPATHTLPVDVARAQHEARIALMASPAEIRFPNPSWFFGNYYDSS
jgi:acetyl esterase